MKPKIATANQHSFSKYRHCGDVQRATNGFTFTELVLVTATICFLIGILAPLAPRHRENTRREACVSNLRQWGAAHSTYVNDNGGIVLETPFTDQYKIGRGPPVVYLFPVEGGNFFNFYTFSKYLPGVQSNLTGTSSWDVTGAWWCPSMKKWDPEHVQQTAAYWKWFDSAYSFYGRVDLWSKAATRPNDLTAKSLDPDRLLMSDAIISNRALPPKIWSYSHGRNAGYYTEASPPGFSGENQLYGDGRVVWKDASQFDLRKMMTRNPDAGMVKGDVGQATYY